MDGRSNDVESQFLSSERKNSIYGTTKLSSKASSSGTGTATRDGVRGYVRVLNVLAVGVLHVGISVALILYNKYLMDADRFPFAVALSTIQMGSSLVMAGILCPLLPSLFPGLAILSARRFAGPEPLSRPSGSGAPLLKRKIASDSLRGLWVFIPIGLCSCCSLVCSNLAYKSATVSSLQFIKESLIICIYVLTIFSGLEAFKSRNAFVLALVSGCLTVAVLEQKHLVMAAAGLQLAATAAQALQAVLTGTLLTQERGHKADPLTMVLGSAPVVLLLLAPLTWMMWEHGMLLRMRLWWRALVGNAVLAFALQVVNAVTIRELTASGLTIVAVLKDVAIVGAAAMLLHESLSQVQILAFTGAIVGISVYSMFKLNPSWFED